MERIVRSLFVSLGFVGGLGAIAEAQKHFSEVDLSGIVQGTLYEMAEGFGGGIAIADFDDDGDLDFFLPNSEDLPDRLIQNLGNGVFDDIADFCGVTGFPGSGAQFKSRSRNALWIDYDGDRRLDLFVAGDCWDCDTISQTPTVPSVLADLRRNAWLRPRLHRQLSDGTFDDVSFEVGFWNVNFLVDGESGGQSCSMVDVDTDPPGPAFVFQHLGGLAAGEFNGDGLPDIFVGQWFDTNVNILRPKNARIFLSDLATGTLNDDGSLLPDAGYNSHWQVIVSDFNDNGGVDLFGAVDSSPDRLWFSDQIPFGEDFAAAGFDRLTGSTDMGTGLGDFNNDGFFDLYLAATNQIIGGENQVKPTQDAFFFADPVARGGGDFSPVIHEDMNESVGILTHVKRGGSWGWGTTAADVDLDGDEDFLLTNGFSSVPGMVKAGATNDWGPREDDFSMLFLNTLAVDGQFHRDFTDWGFDDKEWGSALGAFDFDRDGDLDLAQTVQRTWPLVGNPKTSRFRLLKNNFNDGGTHFWLTVRPRLTTRNTRSIGAIVRATHIVPGSGGQSLTQSRLISAGESFMTQEPYEAQFGFGNVQPANVTITIEWPDGTADSVFILQGNDINRVVTYGWCDMVDLVTPYGQLDGDDLVAYQALFDAGDTRADLIAPVGVDGGDLIEAVTRIANGCPPGSIIATDLP